MRSLSLTRSSPAPRTLISAPAGSSARAASAGISSMRPGTSAGDLEAVRRPVGDANRPGGLARGLGLVPRFDDGAGAPGDVDRRARGVEADASMAMSAPGVPAASAIQNVALETSREP